MSDPGQSGLTPSDFAELYRTHAQAMLLYFQRRLHDAEQATDLLAETFAVAIERAHQFRGAHATDASNWLWAIARSQLSASERHGEVQRRHTLRLGIERRALESNEIERIEELAGLAALRDEIIELVGNLPPEQRDAVRLRILEDRPYEEVASRLRISQTAARARVSRGLRTLQRQLREPRAEPEWDWE